MSNYFIEYNFLGDKKNLENIMAELSIFNFDAFEQNEDSLLAYIKEENNDESIVKNILIKYNISYSKKSIKKINWNKKWEESFEPIVVSNKCTVRANFHPEPTTEIDLIITPKMSFGTGHHSTTYMMLEFILEENITEKTICDIGCGTGILSLLCEKRNGKNIDAIDIDEWCFTNIKENIELNKSKKIIPILGTVKNIITKKYDIILANINKNILLNDFGNYYKIMNENSVIFVSGFYKEDKNDIVKEAEKQGLKYISEKENKNWLSIKFIR